VDFTHGLSPLRQKCVINSLLHDGAINSFHCNIGKKNTLVTICETENKGRTTSSLNMINKTIKTVHFPRLNRSATHRPERDDYITCSSGHFTHTFLANGDKSDCCVEDTCTLSSTSLPPLFPCRTQDGKVPYSLVCDHMADCWDKSDEDFCVFQPCRFEESDCGNGQVSQIKQEDLMHWYA
jgi:hypothetical protein